MKVSVIIATLNRCDILDRCLSEYASQTHTDHEIIVVDNGSTDDTLTTLPQRFPHVKFIAMGKECGPLSLNEAARVATGEVLWRTDDDAYPASPSTLADAVAFMHSHPNVVAMTGEIIEATIGFKPLDYYPFTRLSNDGRPDGMPINEFCGTASMIRRDAFLAAGGFWDAFYLEELDLSARLIANGDEIRYTPWIGVVHLSAFAGKRNMQHRWLLQSEQTIRYQWRYFSAARALYRSMVCWLSLTLSSAFHRFPLSVYVRGCAGMMRAARRARSTERVKMSRKQLHRITMGRTIWDQMFRYYRVRWKARRAQ